MQGDGLTPSLAPAPGLEGDSLLMAAVVRGDRAALADLYDRHSGVLLAVGMRIVGDRAQAEDLLHDVFLEAWHQAAAFDPTRGTVRAWLVTRMRSRALDRRNAGARSARILKSAADETPAASAPAEAAGGDRERVRRLVVSLPDELNAVIGLAYFEGLTCAEIAERLSIPIGTVKSRTARAVAMLKDLIVPGRRNNGDVS
ncbi:MAG TPA: sigma-70 family RNA polymerase sigma factor [Polyangia bacterium]|nr:sigma-70 family RNA polymerase sigma factor [Polyangia bacterium]